MHPKIRSNLIVIPGLFLACGTWLVWLIGYYLSWKNTAFVSMIPPILLFLVMLILPETPYWLIEANKINLAEYEKVKVIDIFIPPKIVFICFMLIKCLHKTECLSSNYESTYVLTYIKKI